MHRSPVILTMLYMYVPGITATLYWTAMSQDLSYFSNPRGPVALLQSLLFTSCGLNKPQGEESANIYCFLIVLN